MLRTMPPSLRSTLDRLASRQAEVKQQFTDHITRADSSSVLLEWSWAIAANQASRRVLAEAAIGSCGDRDVASAPTIHPGLWFLCNKCSLTMAQIMQLKTESEDDLYNWRAFETDMQRKIWIAIIVDRDIDPLSELGA